MRPHANEQVVPGHVVIKQPGDVLVCRLADLRYEPGDDSETEMIRSIWGRRRRCGFEDKGSMQ